jgi:hypothetical protein
LLWFSAERDVDVWCGVLCHGHGRCHVLGMIIYLFIYLFYWRSAGVVHVNGHATAVDVATEKVPRPFFNLYTRQNLGFFFFKFWFCLLFSLICSGLFDFLLSF